MMMIMVDDNHDDENNVKSHRLHVKFNWQLSVLVLVVHLIIVISDCLER